MSGPETSGDVLGVLEGTTSSPQPPRLTVGDRSLSFDAIAPGLDDFRW